MMNLSKSVYLVASIFAICACDKSAKQSGASQNAPVATDEKAATNAAPNEATKSTNRAGKVVELKQFAADKMTLPDLEKAYPAGSTFTIKAILKSDPRCETDCTIELSDGGKTTMMFTLDVANKAKLDSKKAGAEIGLACNPVYEGGSLQVGKSCTVE